MRKFFLILSLVLMACGCGTRHDSTLKMETYETYYRIVQENTHLSGTSMYYSLSGEMITLPDGSHRYYVIVDQPQIAMYDCVVFIVENDILYSEAVKMMPCMGVFDEKVSMVPNQVNREAGYVKGISVSGECSDESVHLHILVEWKDKNRKDTFREFQSYIMSTSGFTPDMTDGQ